MEKSVLEKKWKARKPSGSTEWWYVETIDKNSICVCYLASQSEKVAKQIVRYHNDALKLKEQIMKSPIQVAHSITFEAKEDAQ